jgi:hypothetical protein
MGGSGRMGGRFNAGERGRLGPAIAGRAEMVGGAAPPKNWRVSAAPGSRRAVQRPNGLTLSEDR